ncbi:hypothetical protein HG619_19680 [Pseudomonas syringae]|nr:hypothetical protein [Pseudomonas syringae]
MNVRYIKEARNLGPAKKLIWISSTLMERLIADFDIDYPANRIYRT